MANEVRNLLQTHQDRTVIKQAPDLVVYINGLPYFINDWVGTGGEVVNFNDHVVTASGSADTSTFIPAATVNLTVPNHLKHLFMGPGGNSPIHTMDEIKVFTRGYYLTKSGDTVYHRVFWGVVDMITPAESDTTLEITLSCKGILHMFDLMQFNLAPSAMQESFTGSPIADGFQTNEHAYNPLQIIAHMFLAALEDDVINAESVVNGADRLGDGGSTFQSAYVSKWQQHLKNLTKGVRLFGLKENVRDINIREWTHPPKNSDDNATQTRASETGASVNVQTDARARDNYNLDLIAQFLPSFQIGNIELLQSTVTSRLARVNEMVTTMGWEGYQDLDGSIIIKPPLYNLDPTNTADKNADWNRNPFIIHQDEKLGTDTLVEDSNQVRLTRAAVKGRLSDMMLEDGGPLTPVAVAVDPILLRQFGLRQESYKLVDFICNNAYYLYAYAASELARTNKRMRTYTVTIPMRPELHLGFPIHVPHRDIMAYLENISWSYTRGGNSTMTLSCSMVRPRELMGADKVTNENGIPVRTKNWVPVKNAVLRWTTDPALQVNTNPTNPIGADATAPASDATALTPNQKRFLSQIRNKSVIVGDPTAEMNGFAWRVMDDTGFSSSDKVPEMVATACGHSSPAKMKEDLAQRFGPAAGGFFTKERSVDPYYCCIVQNYAQPYTDAKGYVLARPFPWGRYQTLEDALDTFTRPKAKAGKSGGPTKSVLPFEGSTKSNTASSAISTAVQSQTDAFLLTGLGTPSTASDTTILKLADLQSAISDDVTYFTVAYPTVNDPQASGLAPNPFNALAKDMITPVTTTDASKTMSKTASADYAAGMVKGS